MKTLTREQIQQLTPEQQTNLATMELRRVQKRQRLLKQARESRYFSFATGVGLAVAWGAAAISRSPFWLHISIFALAMAILVQTASVNRRLDALMELLEDEREG
jgi:Flp pilus assembly protein TadB